MDWKSVSKRCKRYFEKYKFVLLILAAGVFLMALPQGQSRQSVEINTAEIQQVDTGDELEEILSHIEGVGRVRVLLTERTGAKTVYQTDTDGQMSGETEDLRVQTVVVTGADRAQQGLVKSVVPPVYLGAIIVCQGGDMPVVKLSVVEAVSAVTGIPADRITVLKMK